MAKYVIGEAGARKLRELMNGRGASGSVATGQNFTFEDGFANPYTVQWSASANDGEGSWIIWLPSDGVLTVRGKTVSVTEDLAEVGEDYPEGWYLLDDVMLDPDDGGTLYLNIRLGSSGAYGPAYFSSTPASGATAIPIAICEADVDDSTGARTVKQFVTSSIVIGETVGCFEISISRTTDESDEETVTASFANPYYRDGAKTYEATTTTIDLTDFNSGCIVCLKIDASLTAAGSTQLFASSASISALRQEETDTSYTTVPLYMLDSDYNVTCDFRKMPIGQMWEA